MLGPNPVEPVEEEIFIDLDELDDDEQWPDGFNADHSLYYES